MTHEVREPAVKYLVPLGADKSKQRGSSLKWKPCLLADLAQIRGGIAKNAGAVIDDPVSVAYLRVANVQDGYLNLAEVNTIEISRQDLNRFAVLRSEERRVGKECA